MTPAPEGANLPPQDLDAEEAVLGAMMINDQAVLTASEIISDPGEFYREAHGTVYRAIIALLARSEPIDAVTVSDELERMGALEQVGGRGFIFGLSFLPLAIPGTMIGMVPAAWAAVSPVFESSKAMQRSGAMPSRRAASR